MAPKAVALFLTNNLFQSFISNNCMGICVWLFHSLQIMCSKPNPSHKLAFFLSWSFLCCFQRHNPILIPQHTPTVNTTLLSGLHLLPLTFILHSTCYWTQLPQLRLSSSSCSPRWIQIKIPGAETGIWQEDSAPGEMALGINQGFLHHCSKYPGIRPAQ